MEPIFFISIGRFVVYFVIGYLTVLFAVFLYDSRRALLALFNLFIYSERANEDLKYYGFKTKKVIGKIWFAWKP